MRTLAKVLATLCFAGVFSYAETWNAKLLDSSCYDSQHSGVSSTTTGGAKNMDRKARENLAKTCAPSASTSNFAILNSAGTVYKLDSEGNTKAAEAMKNGSLKADKDGDFHASVSGSLQGDAVKVDSIHGRGGHGK